MNAGGSVAPQGERVRLARRLLGGLPGGFELFPAKDSDTGAIIHLDDAPVRRLLAGEALKLCELDDVDASRHVPDGPCLLFAHEFFDREDGADLLDYPRPSPETVAKNMYIGRCEGGIVACESPVNLYGLLCDCATHQDLPRSQARYLLPRYALSEVGRDDEYCGRCLVCTCGEPGCGSEFTWKRNGVVLLHFTMGGCELVQVFVRPALR